MEALCEVKESGTCSPRAKREPVASSEERIGERSSPIPRWGAGDPHWGAGWGAAILTWGAGWGAAILSGERCGERRSPLGSGVGSGAPQLHPHAPRSKLPFMVRSPPGERRSPPGERRSPPRSPVGSGDPHLGSGVRNWGKQLLWGAIWGAPLPCSPPRSPVGSRRSPPEDRGGTSG